MKNILTAFFLLQSSISFACGCIPQKFTEKYTDSDFIAKAKIIKVYKNESEEEIYKADILIYNLYKGHTIKSIYIEGRSDGKRGSSCAIFIPENTELIIYAKNFTNGSYTIGPCTGFVYLNQDKRTLRAETREIAMLNILKARKVKYSGDIIFYTDVRNFSNQLSKFNGIALNKNFALYELIFASDITIKSVNIISSFDKRTDSELKEIIENSIWKANKRNFVLDKVPEDSRFLIGLYYYQAEGGYQSIIGTHDL